MAEYLLRQLAARDAWISTPPTSPAGRCWSTFMAATGAAAARKTIVILSRPSPSAAPRSCWSNTIFAHMSRSRTSSVKPAQHRVGLQKYSAIRRRSVRSFSSPAIPPAAILTAMALAHDWRQEGLPQDLIKGAVATSGVYDLEMVMKISVQEQVRMTPRLPSDE